MSAQNRCDERVCAALKVRIAGASGEPTVTRNISTNGLFLLVKQRWPDGTLLKLDLVDRFHAVTIFARVIRAEREGVALLFVELSSEQKEKLRLLIDSLLADGAWYGDRRHNVRIALQGPVVWRHGTREIQSALRNLSDRGASISSAQAPELGAQIVLYLPALPDQAEESARVLGCQAGVVHRSPEGFGVSFLFPTPEFSTAVERLIRSAGL